MNETLAVGLEVVGFSAAHLLPKDLISDTCSPRIRTALCGAQRLFAALHVKASLSAQRMELKRQKLAVRR